MSKYDYVLFNASDKMELPIQYMNLKEVAALTKRSVSSLYNSFNNNNILSFGSIEIERFRKEVKK